MHGLYGLLSPELARPEPGSVQFSPLVPGSRSLEELEAHSLQSILMAAPPGTVERRFALAHALRVLQPGGSLLAIGAKDKGGSRLKTELGIFGAGAVEESRSHHKFCRHVAAGGAYSGITEAIAEGGPRFLEATQLNTQPGVFSWDRSDLGSSALLAALPALSGHGADLGAGLGVLARKVLESREVKELHLVEIDRRAVICAKKNVTDGRARFHWADLRSADLRLTGLDFIVCNPPFHDTGVESRELGAIFVRQAAALLRPQGTLWLVANRHLPYETLLNSLFSCVGSLSESGGFKIFRAER